MIVAIVDVLKVQGQGRIFRMIAVDRYKDGSYEYRRVQKTERDLVADLSVGKYSIINAGLDVNRIKGTTGDLNRFDNGVNKPLVILTEIVDHRSVTLGYKVANCNGDVVSMSLKDLLEHCEKVTAKDGIPIQNGIYVPATDGQKAFIRSYPNGIYPKEFRARKTSKFSKAAAVDKRQGEKNVNKLEEMFTKEQIRELQLGKKNGIDIRIIGNNKLSAEQMRIIRQCEEKGLPGRLFADPAYSIELMEFFQVELMNGAEIRAILNPRYSVAQAMEISVAYEQGLDTSEMDDPDLSHEEMAERRIRLANGMWKKHKVKTDDSWK